MNQKEIPSLWNVWTILGAFAVAGCLLLVTLIGIGWTRPHQAGSEGFVPADLTIIAPPTATVNPTATATPSGTITPPAGQIGVGSYVQISGTEGAGLRIRSAPGLNSDTVFRGEEAETFQVKDGPQAGRWLYLVVSRRPL